MKKTLLFVLAVFLILAPVIASAEAVDFTGKYIGYAYVHDRAPVAAKTDVRVDIHRGDGDLCVVELNYLDGKVARFNKVAPKSGYSLEIDEPVRTGSAQKAIARGMLYTADGSLVSGTIEVKDAGAPPDAPALSTIKILVTRLKERPLGATPAKESDK